MLITGLGNIEAGLFGTNQYFQAELVTTLTFLENVGLLHEDLVLNEMGFYNVSKNVTDGITVIVAKSIRTKKKIKNH